MSTASANQPREDSIFSGKVKAAIKACDGSLVSALADFDARHKAAVAAGAKGLSYTEFLSYLSDHGVSGLSEFEANYLCSAFDDGVPPHKHHAISAATFTRHLTGLNYRRMKAVRQAWQTVLDAAADAEGDHLRDTVSADELLASYRAAATASAAAPAAAWGGSGREAQLQGTFCGSTGGSSTGRGPALVTKARSKAGGAPAEGSDGDGNAAAEEVTQADFIAFYAGLSPEFGSDESFEISVLREWAADKPQQPKLAQTQRTWDEGGDPLAITETHYVRDALHPELGLSSKSYNYSHMAREPPYVEPLAPLDRVDLMESVAHRTYPAYDENQQAMADPLATRRGQPM